MKEVLENGKSSLMLVPEIALTPVFSKRLRVVFGNEVAILHSSLSTGERFDEWRRIRNGAARIVIGTRSAVFAPLQNLGLVIVDEEHDTSYRQHEMPFYHGRDVAIVRANFAARSSFSVRRRRRSKLFTMRRPENTRICNCRCESAIDRWRQPKSSICARFSKPAEKMRFFRPTSSKLSKKLTRRASSR